MQTKFTFTAVPKAVFPAFDNKENQDLFMKWQVPFKQFLNRGIKDNMQVYKFRFDQIFNENTNPQSFLLDFINSQQTQEFFKEIQNGKKVEEIANLKYQSVKCTQTTFDVNEQLSKESKAFILDIIDERGYIMKTFEDYEKGITINDKLREALIKEESELYEVLDENIRSEFIFKIFQSYVLGGSVCQYEDYMEAYMKITIQTYKDLVTVSRDSETKLLKIQTKVFKIENNEVIHSLQELQLFKSDHIQNFCFIAVDMFNRQVNVWYHQWIDFW